MYRIYKILVAVMIVVLPKLAQAQAPTPKLSFNVQSFRQDDRIIVRWLLQDAKQWRYANTRGFNIERAEGNSDKFIKLNKEVIKPLSEEALSKVDTNSHTFESMSFILNTPTSEEERGDQDDQTYSMFFVSTSYETESAVATASAYIDASIEKGKTYTYRVTVANTKVPQSDNKFFVEAANTSLPVGPILKPVFSNRSVTFFWDNKPVVNDYFATVLEKSTDSVTFTQVGKPMIKIEGEDEKPEDKTKMQTYDSIPNRIKYFYRIKGLNVFGVTGPANNIISGVAYPDLNVIPQISSVDSTSPGKLTIVWALPDTLLDAVAKYEIYQSKKVDTDYVKIDEMIGASFTKKEFSFKPKELSNYFKVKALGNREGQIVESAPYLYQLIDSIPPATPIGLTGTVDTMGVVTLNWSANTEPDFFGYRILRAQKKEDEFVILNAEPQYKTVFKDTLPLNQLNTVMYYRIAAVDARYNESAASGFIEVKRPDLIPPAPPRMDVVIVKDNKVYIEWIKSFSKDVASYNIYKMLSTDSIKAWKQLIIAKNTDTSYLDVDVKPGITYYYSIEAVDEGKLKSPLSEPMSVLINKIPEAKKGIKNITSYATQLNKYIELSWQNSETDANEYWIYRSSPGEDLSLVATLPAAKKRFVDEDVKPNTQYKYAIKVVYKDGKSSKMERIEVTY